MATPEHAAVCAAITALVRVQSFCEGFKEAVDHASSNPAWTPHIFTVDGVTVFVDVAPSGGWRVKAEIPAPTHPEAVA